MQRALRYFTAFSLLAFVLFAAVGSASAQSAGLGGTSWKLIEIKSPALVVKNTADQSITINFDDKGAAGGESTCNVYGSTYTTGADELLTITDIISTLRACVDTGLMDLETEYFAALAAVTHYEITGGNLILHYGSGGTLTFQPTTQVIGMPQTGAGFGFAETAPFAILGVSLILLGAGFLVWKRAS